MADDPARAISSLLVHIIASSVPFGHSIEGVCVKTIYVLVKNKIQKEVLQAVRRAHRRVKGDFAQVFKSITADNGSDEVYYAYPFSSWERGVMRTRTVFYTDFYRKERISVR